MTRYARGLLLAGIMSLSASSGSIEAAEQDWVDRAVHNFGAPINTLWDEGELSFADDGTMVFCSAREDLAVAPGDPKDLYITTSHGRRSSTPW
jgi:hypothetical protein